MSRALLATILMVAVFAVASVAVIMSPPATVAAARETTLSPADCPGRLAGLPYRSGREIVDDEAGSVDLTCQYQRRQTRAGDPQVMVSLFYFTPAREPKGIGGFCWSLRDDLDDPEIVTESPPGGSLQPGGEHFIRVQYRALNHKPNRVRNQAIALAETLIGEGRVLPCPRRDEVGGGPDGEARSEQPSGTEASEPPSDDGPDAGVDAIAQAFRDALADSLARTAFSNAILEAALVTEDESVSDQLFTDAYGHEADNFEQLASDLDAIQGLPGDLRAVRDALAARARTTAEGYRRAASLPADSDEQLDAIDEAREAEDVAGELADRLAAALGVDRPPDPLAEEDTSDETGTSG